MKREPSHSDCKMSPAGTAENRPRRTPRQPSAVPAGLVTICHRGWSFSGNCCDGRGYWCEQQPSHTEGRHWKKHRFRPMYAGASMGHPSRAIGRGYGRTKCAGFVALRKGAQPITFRPSLCRNHSCAVLGVGGSRVLLVPIGLAALLDLFVLLFLRVVQDRLYATVTFLTDAVHLCLSIAGSERGIGA